MGMGDQMFFGDVVNVRLGCAHNHPEQKPDEKCILCGADLPQRIGEQNGNTSAGSG